jgi:hypothetical protein
MYLQLLVTIPHMNFNDNAAGISCSLLCGQSDYKHEELATFEDETTTLSRNVGNKDPVTWRPIPAEQKLQVNSCFSQLLRKHT